MVGISTNTGFKRVFEGGGGRGRGGRREGETSLFSSSCCGHKCYFGECFGWG